MKIALVSYELAGRDAGGIGTYVRNAARMLSSAGHRVEVFTARTDESPDVGAAVVHEVTTASRADFARDVLPPFADRHAVIGFDVVEGPDYMADAAAIASAFPDLPIVVRLHTASRIVAELNRLEDFGVAAKARYVLGGLRRGRLSPRFWRYDRVADRERQHALRADEIAAPTLAVARRTASLWQMSVDDMSVFPLPFDAPDALTRIPAATTTGRVSFIGKLEMRKGAMTFARAIPAILARHPDARFRFIGPASPHPATGRDMRDELRAIAGAAREALELVGHVPQSELADHLADSDVCVFPSRWESFGYVCLEAMAAARGVVASRAGGMAEMIVDGESGRLVPPESANALAAAVIDLLDRPAARIAMGESARARVLERYSCAAILPQHEASYERAIMRRRVRAAPPAGPERVAR